MATITRTYQQTLLVNYVAAIQAFAQGINGSYMTSGLGSQVAGANGGCALPLRLGPTMKAVMLGTGALSVAINAAGSGYKVGDILTSTGGGAGVVAPIKLRVTAVNPAGGAITAVQVLSPGLGFNLPSLSSGNLPSAPTFTGGSGTTATFTLTLQNAGNIPNNPYGYPAPAA